MNFSFLGYIILAAIGIAYGSIVFDDYRSNLKLAKLDGENLLWYSIRYWAYILFWVALIFLIGWFIGRNGWNVGDTTDDFYVEPLRSRPY